MTKLPGLIALRHSDPSVTAWAQSVNEHLEVLKGSRGDPGSRLVTISELEKSDPSWTPKPDDIFTIAQKLAAMPSFVSAIRTATIEPTDMPQMLANLDALSRRVSDGIPPGLSAMFKQGTGPTFGPNVEAKPWFIVHKMGLSKTDDGKAQTTVGELVKTLTDAIKCYVSWDGKVPSATVFPFGVAVPVHKFANDTRTERSYGYLTLAFWADYFNERLLSKINEYYKLEANAKGRLTAMEIALDNALSAGAGATGASTTASTLATINDVLGLTGSSLEEHMFSVAGSTASLHGTLHSFTSGDGLSTYVGGARQAFLTIYEAFGKLRDELIPAAEKSVNSGGTLTQSGLNLCGLVKDSENYDKYLNLSTPLYYGMNNAASIQLRLSDETEALNALNTKVSTAFSVDLIPEIKECFADLLKSIEYVEPLYDDISRAVIAMKNA